MNVANVSAETNRSNSFMRRSAGLACAAALLLGLAAPAPAQLSTNYWALNGGGNWSAISSWSNSAVANAAGALVFMTGLNNTGAGFGSTTTVSLDMDATLGYLIFGDIDRGSAAYIAENVAAPTRTLTFDTGDGKMALLSHGSGDLSRNIGNNGDYINTRILVSDPQGLYIDNFYNLTLYGGATNARALDGGGHDIVKAEDGYLLIHRIVTNVNNLVIRDGTVRFNYDNEINVNMRSDITNIVLGTPSGAIDLGEMHPLQTTTNYKEGTFVDRSQLPLFEVYGINNTNSAVQMTNSYNLVMNRGVVRLYSRGLVTAAQQNGNYQPGLMSGSVTLNGHENVNWIWIEASEAVGNSLTTTIQRTVFSGPITGAGGFTKYGFGEMTLTGTNDFTGRMVVGRYFDRAVGLSGGVALRDGGMVTGVEGITLNHTGDLYIDNRTVNIADRVNDAAWLVGRGFNKVEIAGNGSAPSSETIGRVTNLFGQLSFELDRAATPQGMTLNLAGLTRTPGSTVTFNSSDVAQGIFATNVNALTVNIADAGSLTQIGSAGLAGTTNRSVVQGVFGGDAVDYAGSNPNYNLATRADEFMTLDGTRLRTLDMQTEVAHLGNRTNLALTITQASAPADANVNINFMVTNFSPSANHILNKVVQGSVTFNSIRIGMVSNWVNNQVSDAGATLLISEQGRLTSESGMLLFGRDVGNVDGDGRSAISSWIAKGILDLDGTSGNREAIIQNESGQTAFIRSILEAGNGLTKSGTDSLVLDAANRITGTINVARGNLYLYDGRAVGAATQIVLSGRSTLIINNQTVVKGVDLIVNEPDQSQSALLSEGRYNVWGGDIILRYMDPTQIGNDYYTATISATGVGATLTLLGDLGMDTNRLATADLNTFDSPRWQTGSGYGILNLYGNVGDYVVNGEAVTYDASVFGNPRINYGDITNRINDENYVLRANIDGNPVSGDEHNVNIMNPWRAVGRLYASQGTIRYLGDPALGKGDFYTDQVLTNSNPQYSGQTGFELGGSSLDANGHVMFLLTKDGQRFNAERWSASNSGRINNDETMGLEHFGPTNATVTIGNDYDDGTPDQADNRITMSREFRLYAHNGWDNAAGTASVGRVNVRMSLYGDQNATLTKIGNGVVYLQAPTNQAYDEVNEIRTNILMGGELVLDRNGTAGNFDSTLQRMRVNGSTLILNGGDLTHQGAPAIYTSENYASNLLVLAGDSIIRSRTTGATGSNTLFIATGTGATITRQAGGTVNFFKDLSAGGNAGFQVGLTPQRLGSWAVVSSNGLPGFAFAATGTGQWIGPAIVEADSYGAGYNTDVVPDFFGAKELSGNTESETLRFNADTGLGLNGWQYTVNHGGILVTPNAINYASNGAAAIANGTLISSNGELIVHNYNTAYGFGIGAAITGNTAFTHSGTGETTLSGANTFLGTVYLNGGTLTIDSASRLGDTNNTLQFRGGVLNMTASMDLGGRTNILGADGGTFRVAAGQTVTLGGMIKGETNFFGSALLNSGHGDFVKEGSGTLVFVGTNAFDGGTYEGLTDIRGGTLEIRRQFASFSNSVFGSAKSFYDGTIVRSNATLVFALTNILTFAGTNMTSNTMPYYEEWMILEDGAKIIWKDPGAGYQGIPMNGVIDIRGSVILTNASDDVYLNGNTGYIMGSGTLRSGGSKLVYGYNPEFTGKIVVESGGFFVASMHQWAFPNASGIDIGVSDNASRGPGLYFRAGDDGVPTVYDVPQEIRVLGNSYPNLGFSAWDWDHDDVANLFGKLDLSDHDNYGNNRDLTLYLSGNNLNTRAAYNGDTLDDDAYLNILGEITGGNKRIRTYMSQSGATLDKGAQSPAEMNFRLIVTMAGTNTGWTGALEVGNRQSTTVTDGGPDFDKQHIMRFGLDQGLPTWGIGSNNIVVLRHDAFLQAHGSQVTIGTLIADGDSGGDGFWGNQPVTNTWLENGGFNPGTLTIVQVSNKVFSGGIRNGEVYTRYATNSPAAALSIVKAGPASLTLIQSNTYSGSTRIMAGTLALTGTAAIAQSHTIQIDSGAFLNVTGLTAGAMTLASGQTLKGQGTMVGGLIVGSGSTVAPGSSPGVLTAQNDVTFQSGSTFEVELIGTLAGEADQLLMAGASDTLTLGGATLSVLAPNVLPYGSSFAIIDGFSSLDVTRFAGLPNSGDTLTGGVNQFEIQYNANDVTLTVIPEPASLGLMGLMGIAGWLLRRRRR